MYLDEFEIGDTMRISSKIPDKLDVYYDCILIWMDAENMKSLIVFHERPWFFDNSIDVHYALSRQVLIEKNYVQQHSDEIKRLLKRYTMP